MEFDEVENYLSIERERRKTDRERELERELQKIAAKHRDAMVAESACHDRKQRRRHWSDET